MPSIQQSLAWANQQLKKSGIESCALDAEVLLAFVLKTTKEKIYAHPEKKLSVAQTKKYQILIKRRAKHEPVAYLTGRKEFFGLDFLINKKVLIPRPETELMAEETLSLLQKSVSKSDGRPKLTPNIIIDIGTGSGCVIIAIAESLASLRATRGSVAIPYLNGIASSPSAPRNDNFLNFYAIDVSRDVLNIAKQNAQRHGLEKQIKFLQGNLLEPMIKNSSLITHHSQLIITVNLPYLPTAEWRRTPPDVKNYEPRLALDGGSDGLKYYRQLFIQLKKNCYVPHVMCYVLCEICPHQANALTKLARKFFPKARIQIKKDLCGHKRLAIIKT